MSFRSSRVSCFSSLHLILMANRFVEVTKAKVSVIVCVKRHHTRFFPLDKGDKNGNIAVGTVVENGHGKDIFMVSHAGLQGTVRPTHYMMLHDENNLTAVEFQRICNNVCYAYGRATVSVSIGWLSCPRFGLILF